MRTMKPRARISSKLAKFSSLTGILLAPVLLIACGGASSPPPPPPPAAATPTIWPVAGTYSPAPGSPLAITLNDATPGATIYYTTDGTAPSTSSTKYTASFSASATTTVQAIAVASGYSQSGIAAATFTIPTQNRDGPAVSVFVTTSDQSELLAPQSAQAFTTATGGSNIIVVDEAQTYQQVEGFGSATTDSAAYLLNEVATPAALTSTMSDLFTRNGNGIGLSFIRNPMGASDIVAHPFYSFDDNGGAADLSLTNFSIAPDQKDIIPLLLQAKQLNPQIKIMANPWSPPGWMKSSGSMIGGSLLTDAATRTAFANYFVKYIQAYYAASIPIDYISLQNEPRYSPPDYPGMLMDAPTQALLLKNYLLPALTTAGFSTRVLLYDHNWDQPSYPETILSDPVLAASTQIAGTAWHGYGGTPGAMTTVQNSFPNLGNYETEHSGGIWVANQIKTDFEEIIQVMRNYGKSYVKWSLALDQNHGPHTGGCGTCNPIVIVNSSSGAVTYTTEFYTLGQFSKFLLPGATRVFSSDANGIVSAAFVNAAPDNSRVLIVFNDSTTTQIFQVQWGTQPFTYTLPSLAGATFRWAGIQIGSYTISAKSEIQSSSYSNVSGLQTESTSDTNGGYDLASAANGSYAVYKNVDFGSGASSVNARLACDASAIGGGNCGGTLEFHLDNVAGTLISSVVIPSTGGWQSWQTATAPASGAVGVHDLYVVFKAPNSGATGLGSFNWFQFN